MACLVLIIICSRHFIACDVQENAQANLRIYVFILYSVYRVPGLFRIKSHNNVYQRSIIARVFFERILNHQILSCQVFERD